MLMTAGHLVGWPVAQGGSASITQGLTNYFHSLGGITRTAFPVRRLADLPEAEHYFFDTTPRALAEICGEALPAAYRQKLQKFRYGAGAFKIDLALSGPIPWLNEACRRAGTVHVGGTAENLLEGERLCYQGRVAAKPYVLLAQQSVVDANRAPAGQHTCWAYCHVPHGWPGDARDAILNHIEEYAPGFRSLILAEHVMRPNDFQNYNANYIGGDIIGGMQDVWQILARPVLRLNPYTTPNPKILLCSSSTPPGGGVHGMCGFHAAQAVLG
jgi:phytoene dehydrogenase-like protein